MKLQTADFHAPDRLCARIHRGSDPLPQSEALQTAGCVEIFEEHASGGNRARPVLARLLERISKGDTLVVVRIDRLARSLSHLLEVIERLEAKGAFFRSIQDPIDTGSPQGKFTLQVLGAAAEFERALIRERTKAGWRAPVPRAGSAGTLDCGPKTLLLFAKYGWRDKTATWSI